MQSRLIFWPMVVGKLCMKEHSTEDSKKKTKQVSALQEQVASISCLSD